MSSRGPRAVGTDGTDFRHREVIAPQYNISSILKRRLTYIYTFHALLWLCSFLHILPQILVQWGINPEPYIGKWNLPAPPVWELAWVAFSLIPTIFGYLSLNKNRAGLMRVSLIGQLLFCMGPILFGVFQHSYDLMDLYNTRKSKVNIFGLPSVALLYLYFSLCMQTHGFSAFYGWKLVRSWSVTKKRA